MEKRNKMTGLGRGLGALLADTPPSEKSKEMVVVAPMPKKVEVSMNEISVHDIETNPYQPRTYFDQEALQELAESIRIQGIIQPITVRRIEHGKYQLISGERRLQASKIAGLTQVPAYIRTADDQQMLEMALIENIQRENLNAIEIALSYQRLMHECSLKQEELGDRVGKNRTTVNNYIRLLKLPPTIQASLRDNKISMGHARAIINIDNPDTQLKIFKKIIDEDWSVRRVEEAVRNLSVSLEDSGKPRTPTYKHDYSSLSFQLSGYFGSKVLIKADESHKGEIKIPFTSQTELERILNTLKIQN